MKLDNTYLLESYEACLQFIEWIETKLHEIWPSSDYEKNKHKIQRRTGTHKPFQRTRKRPRVPEFYLIFKLVILKSIN